MNTKKLPPLTSDLFDQILFAMQDQSAKYLFVPSLSQVVRVEDWDSEKDEYQESFSLPEWTSRDGYNLMVQFASNCKDRGLERKLMGVLQSHRRGVFRAFRDVLEQDEEQMKKWYEHRDAVLGRVIRKWYQELMLPIEREEGSEEESQLSCEDFLIKKDSGDYQNEISELCGAKGPFDALVCLAPDDRLAGFLCYRLHKQNGLTVLAYYVKEEYRRTGLFNLMFDKFLSEIKQLEGFDGRLNFPVYKGFEFLANKLAPLRPEAVCTFYACSFKK